METSIGDLRKETVLYHYIKKVRPYLDEVIGKTEWTDLNITDGKRVQRLALSED